MLLLVEETPAGNAISHVCMEDCSTLKFPQASFTQSCSEAMVLPWLGEATFADNAVYHSWAKKCLTLRSLQDLVIRCSFEVMALLLLLDKMMKDNATFHSCRMECHTLKFLRVDCIAYFSEVMARLLLVEGTMKGNAIFHRWKPEVATLAAGSYFANRVLCNWNFSGNEAIRVSTRRSDMALNACKLIAHELDVNIQDLQLALPSGQLLLAICLAHPQATVADVSEHGN